MIISSIEIYKDLAPEIIMAIQTGDRIDLIAIIKQPLFVATLIVNAAYLWVSNKSIKKADSEKIGYTEEQVDRYLNETTEILCEYLRRGDYKMAKKVTVLQERFQKKAKWR